ncbi:MAG: hypothetical protein JKY48_11975 [Flavobacteriales bacterium]|nr:hypothetical protein [Flavobacteriales bacterium]
MSEAPIKDILERYYEGETTLKEEKQLVDFFSQESIPAELKSEQISFLFYQTTKQERIESDVLNLESIKESPTKIISIRPLIKRFITVAASLVIISGAYYFIQKPSSNKHITYTEVSESQMAYLETKKALLLISQKLNKGTKNLDKISKLNEVKDLLSSKN